MRVFGSTSPNSPSLRNTLKKAMERQIKGITDTKWVWSLCRNGNADDAYGAKHEEVKKTEAENNLTVAKETTFSTVWRRTSVRLGRSRSRKRSLIVGCLELLVRVIVDSDATYVSNFTEVPNEVSSYFLPRIISPPEATVKLGFLLRDRQPKGSSS